jgi:hypothetical protein
MPRKKTKPPRHQLCTTDAFQGFRKMTNFPTVALAVSHSNELVEGKAYDAPAGWHWATVHQQCVHKQSSLGCSEFSRKEFVLTMVSVYSLVPTVVLTI